MLSIDLPIFSSFLIAFGVSKLFKTPEKDIKSDKIILVIDPVDTLVKYKFSFLKFNYIFYKRKFTEEFLFNLGCIYDIFFITDDDMINRKVYNFIDPLNISCYRAFTTDKKKEINKLKKNNRVIVLDSKDNPDEGYLNIKSFDIESSSNNLSDNHNMIEKDSLLDVINFFSTLSFLNIKDYIKTIDSYKNKDFFVSFDRVQRKIFKMRNMLNLFSDNKYAEVKKQICKDKIDNYRINKDLLMNYK